MMKIQEFFNAKICLLLVTLFYVSAQIMIGFPYGKNQIMLAFSDFLLPVLGIIGIFLMKKEDWIFSSRFLLAFAGISIVFLYSSILRDLGFVSWGNIKLLGLSNILLCALMAYLLVARSLDYMNEKGRNIKFFNIIVYASCFVVFLGVLYFFYVKMNYKQNDFLGIEHPRRLSGFMRNPNAYGFYLLCLTLILFGFLKENRMFSRGVLWGGIFLSVLGVVLTGSRGAMLAFAVALVFWVLLNPRMFLQVAGLIIAACVTPFILTQVSKAFQSLLTWWTDTEVSSVHRSLRHLQPDYLNQKILIIGKDTGTNERLEVYQTAIKLWLENPIFGKGLGYFKENAATLGYSEGHVIHNTGLWLLAELGLVGFLLVATLFIYLFRLFWMNRDNWYCQGMCAVLIAAAVMSQTSEIMYQRHLWILIGIGLAVAKYNQDKKKAVLV